MSVHTGPCCARNSLHMQRSTRWQRRSDRMQLFSLHLAAQTTHAARSLRRSAMQFLSAACSSCRSSMLPVAIAPCRRARRSKGQRFDGQTVTAKLAGLYGNTPVQMFKWVLQVHEIHVGDEGVVAQRQDLCGRWGRTGSVWKVGAQQPAAAWWGRQGRGPELSLGGHARSRSRSSQLPLAAGGLPAA